MSSSTAGSPILISFAPAKLWLYGLHVLMPPASTGACARSGHPGGCPAAGVCAALPQERPPLLQTKGLHITRPKKTRHQWRETGENQPSEIQCNFLRGEQHQYAVIDPTQNKRPKGKRQERPKHLDSIRPSTNDEHHQKCDSRKRSDAVPRRFVWNLTARIHRSGARWGLWATRQSELSTNPPGGAFC